MKRMLILFIILPALVLAETAGIEDAMSRAQKFHRDGVHEKALQWYKTALDEGGNRALIYFNMGNLHYLAGRPWESVRCYKRVVKLVPDFMTAHLNIAKIYYRYGDYPAAVALCREALEIENDHECLLVMGASYLGLELPAEAVRCFTRAKRIKPGDTRSYYYSARAYLSIGDHASAIDEIEEAMAVSKEPETLRPYLADLCYSTGDYKKAASLYETVIIDSANDKRARLRLAECYRKLGMPFLAIDSLEQAADIHKNDADILTSLGKAYIDLEMFDRGEDILIRAMTVDTLMVKRHLRNLAVLYHNRGERDRLDKLIRRLTERKPSVAAEIRELLSE